MYAPFFCRARISGAPHEITFIIVSDSRGSSYVIDRIGHFFRQFATEEVCIIPCPRFVTFSHHLDVTKIGDGSDFAASDGLDFVGIDFTKIAKYYGKSENSINKTRFVVETKACLGEDSVDTSYNRALCSDAILLRYSEDGGYGSQCESEQSGDSHSQCIKFE